MRAGTARTLSATVLALCLLGASVPAADASFHVMKVREVAGTSGPAANDAYVELQMYSPFQNFLDSHELTIHDETGAAVDTCPLTMVPNGADQSTVLIGDTAVDSDISCADLGELLAPANLGDAGAVCFDAIPEDCVSWGDAGFTGEGSIPDGAAPFDDSLPNTLGSLTRLITGGSCATALDAGDDTNNTVADFDEFAQSPRKNSVTPTETACSPPPGGGSGGGGTTTPTTQPKKCKKGQKLVKGKCRKKKRKKK